MMPGTGGEKSEMTTLQTEVRIAVIEKDLEIFKKTHENLISNLELSVEKLVDVLQDLKTWAQVQNNKNDTLNDRLDTMEENVEKKLEDVKTELTSALTKAKEEQIKINELKDKEISDLKTEQKGLSKFMFILTGIGLTVSFLLDNIARWFVNVLGK